MIWVRWALIVYIAVTCILLARSAWKIRKDGDRETDNEDAMIRLSAPYLWPITLLGLWIWKRWFANRKNKFYD